MTKCPECGTQFGLDAPSGLCPHCLVQEGLALLTESAQARPAAGAGEATTGAKAGSRAPVTRFGDYELLGEIARGGMGVVYHARQTSLNRTVALKMIRSGHLATVAEVQRFRTEATAAAQLDHPHIVPIYEIGEHEGQHYFTMKLVEGGSLAETIAGRPMAPRRAARLLATIARAVHFAHQRGILHRDLKPTNILIDAEGEPQLTDFGLAKLLGSDSTLTKSAEVMGSASYMSPEQAAGQTCQLSTATDIYSLGAILYEMLTGQPPLRGESFLQTLRRVVETEPPRPSALAPGLDRDLETICLKCLEKAVSRRYASAETLAQDLERWLAGETILARPSTRWERTVKWARRKPAVAALVGLVVVTGVGGLLGVVWQWREAEWRARELRRNLYAADIKLAQRALEENNLGRAVALLSKHRPARGNDEDLRGFEWSCLWDQTRSQDLGSYTHDGFVESVAFSPDGRLVASLGRDHTVRVWDALSQQSLTNLSGVEPEARREAAVGFSPGGRFLWASLPTEGGTNALWVWTTQDWRLAGRLPGLFGSSFFSADDRALYSGLAGKVLAWDTATWQSRATTVFAGLGRLVARSANGLILITTNASAAETVAWSVPERKPIASSVLEQTAQASRQSSVAVSPDGRCLAIAGWTGWVRLFDTASGRLMTNWTAHASSIYGLAFSPDGQQLATGGFDQMIYLWEVPTGRKLGALRGHRSEVWAIAFSPDGQFLASGGKDSSVRLWPSRTETKDFTLPGAMDPLGFRANGSQLVAVKEGSLGLWDVRTCREVGALASDMEQVAAMASSALSPDGRMMAAGTGSGQVLLWTSLDAPHQRAFQAHDRAVTWLEFSSDQRLLASASGKGARVWDLQTGRQVLDLPEACLRASFSPDGRKLITGGPGYTAILWEVASGRRLAILRDHRWTVSAMLFTPDSKRAVTTCIDGLARVWDARTGQLLAVLEGHLEGIPAAAFTPDGRTLATGSTDDTVKLWSMETYQELVTLRGFDDDIGALLFSPDGQTLAVGFLASSGAPKPVQLVHAPSLAGIDAREGRQSTRH